MEKAVFLGRACYLQYELLDVILMGQDRWASGGRHLDKRI